MSWKEYGPLWDLGSYKAEYHTKAEKSVKPLEMVHTSGHASVPAWNLSFLIY